jgi:hypothetical protein
VLLGIKGGAFTTSGGIDESSTEGLNTGELTLNFDLLLVNYKNKLIVFFF